MRVLIERMAVPPEQLPDTSVFILFCGLPRYRELEARHRARLAEQGITWVTLSFPDLPVPAGATQPRNSKWPIDLQVAA